MKITNLSFERLELKLTSPYTIAYETISKTTNFILKAETDTGIVGYGCAAPDKVVTEESEEDVEHALNDIIVPFLKGQDVFMFTRILTELKVLLQHRSSSLAMVDMLLLDLVSKKAGLPLYQFLGGYRHSIPTSITMGILPLGETLKIADEFVAQGFLILKIKGGLNLEEDIEKMLRLREKHPDIILRFDGNQGFTVADSIAFVFATKEVNIEIFEQPTKVSLEKDLGEVTHGVSIPVMADESLKTLTDAFRLAQNKLINMVNIKLMKVGGITKAMHINSVARSAKIEAMVGCIDECGLGISAGLHFALSRPNIKYADLDGHLDMLHDPYKNLFTLKNGILYPSEHAGLGKVEV